MILDLLAPAKINLGLEVLGRRPDGYHELATVFQSISLFDRIRIERADADSVRLIDHAGQIEANLAERALIDARAAGLVEGFHRISIDKRIPIAAGLGGASADAAAVLTGFGHWYGIEAHTLATLALQLGSDVPFLLRGGAALAGGRGEILEPVPSLRDCWIVLACPEVHIERKTARLYASLSARDFSDGRSARTVAAALRAHRLPAAGDLDNVFSRSLEQFVPGIDGLLAAFRKAGAPFVALSGAGPAHYTIVRQLHEAVEIGRGIATQAPIPVRTFIARPVATGIQIHNGKTPPAGGAL